MTEHRRWWRNPTFWIALFLPPTISYFAAQMGSNRAIERKQAAFEITTNNLSEQFKSMRSEFAGLSARIDSRLGDIGYVKALAESHARDIASLQDENRQLRAFLTDQVAYNFNVNKAMTEIVTTLRLRGLSAPAIPTPPKLKRGE